MCSNILLLLNREMAARDGANIFYYCCVAGVAPTQDLTHNTLTWDERYAPFIRRAGFLPLAQLVTGGLSMMDSATLTALVNWWHLETLTFHLPCGETTMMLQDVTMILRLPIDGTPVCGPVSPAGWRDFIRATVSIHQPRRCRGPEGQEAIERPLRVAHS
jgi:hypothetical protein